MKLSDARSDVAKDFLGRLETLRNKPGGGDSNFMNIQYPDKGKRVNYQVRPVGRMESVRSHYIPKIISEYKDFGLNIFENCIGQNQGCPVCNISRALQDLKMKNAKDASRPFWATEKCFWNVIPRGNYDWGDGSPRALILSFGALARASLEPIITDLGNPADIDDGFDLNYVIFKKVRAVGSEYKFVPVTETVRGRGELSQKFVVSPLTDDEMDYDFVDLKKYTDEPDDDTLDTLESMLSIEAALGETKVSGRRDIGKPTPEREVKPECFANSEIHHVKNPICRKCSFFRDCRLKIRADNEDDIPF